MAVPLCPSLQPIRRIHLYSALAPQNIYIKPKKSPPLGRFLFDKILIILVNLTPMNRDPAHLGGSQDRSPEIMDTLSWAISWLLLYLPVAGDSRSTISWRRAIAIRLKILIITGSFSKSSVDIFLKTVSVLARTEAVRFFSLPK